MAHTLNLEQFSNWCKSNAFIYPSSEIYGGFSAVYDYGHYGILLKNNIQKEWLKSMIQTRVEQDVLALDSSIYMSPAAWKASGHIDSFDDPQIDCKSCKARFRADHILEDFDIDADKASLEFINEKLNEIKSTGKLKCKNCGKSDFTEAKVFSLMVKSNLGSPTDALTEENITYPRPETCGGIYLQYKNIVNTLHPKLPFGIAQVGKAFRNEIVARQFVFRTREFEQMEMQYFFDPESKDYTLEEIFENWHQTRWNWYKDLGISEEKLNWKKHTKLAHYASMAFDIEYNYQILGGFKELEGIHARGDWDLSQHQKFSGVDLTYFDQSTNRRLLPHIIETSTGLNRNLLMFLDNSYEEENIDGDKRIVLKLDKRLSPIKVAILPLSKKDELSIPAMNIWMKLSERYMCEYDASGSIGKRYRRQDEIGTPYCITFDFDSLSDDSVTIRDRDTMKQERVKITELEKYIII